MEKYNFYEYKEFGCSGEIQISDERHIRIILNNKVRNVHDRYILGRAGEYNCVLINNYLNEVFPKKSTYISNYLLMSKHYRFNKIDDYKKMNIKSIKYSIPCLESWLNFQKFKIVDNTFVENNTIIINAIEDINLIDNDEYCVYIHFEKGINNFCVERDGNLNSFRYNPFIFIDYKKGKTIDKIYEDIFFVNTNLSLFIGYCDNIDSMFINFDELPVDEWIVCYDSINYSINLNDKEGFEKDYLFPFENIKSILNKSFDKWYSLYYNLKYKNIMNIFFKTHYFSNIERFLNNSKIIEAIYDIEQMDLDVNLCNEKNLTLLNSLIKEDSFSCAIDEILDGIGILKNKRNNVKRNIAKNFLHSLEYQLKNRVASGDKIKKYDFFKIIERKFKIDDVNTKLSNVSPYLFINNTRNYYTHLKQDDENIIKEDKLLKYIFLLNLIILNYFLDFIGVDSEIIKQHLYEIKNFYIYNIEYDGNFEEEE